MNISSKFLTKSQISLLTKGPSFCPSTSGNYFELKADISEFNRKLKLREKFFDEQYIDTSIVKEKSDIEVNCSNPDLSTIINDINSLVPLQTDIKYNLSKEESNAIKELKSMNDIIIKKADKGNTLVIMDTSFYEQKLVLNDHLLTNTYEKVADNRDKKVMEELEALIKKHFDCFTKNERIYINNKTWKSSNFYVQPKIHKSKIIINRMKENNSSYLKMDPPNDLKARPIVAGPVSPTQRLSELLEKLLTPLVKYLKSYIKDDWDFLNKLPREIEYECNLYTCDIVSLYTSIPHDLGVTALKYWFDKRRDLIPTKFTKDFIIESCLFILTNNNFIFNSTLYHQLTGTAMGTKFAPPYACLVIGYLEETKLNLELRIYFNEYFSNLILEIFLRYLDDGFILWPSELDINIFINILNQLNPSISFTIEPGKKITVNGLVTEVINFLDISIILHHHNRTIETDIYYKETNTHYYLDYQSHHPNHIKNNVPYNLAKRIVVFTSNPSKEKERLKELYGWLEDCHYPPDLIKKAFHRARLQGPAPAPPTENEEILPFVTTYYNNFSHQNTVHLINNKLKYNFKERIQTVFGNTKTVLALKQPANLLRQLTRAKFTTNTISDVTQNGLFKNECNDTRCNLCKTYIQQCSSFKTANGYTWNIKCHINCRSKNVLYYLKCCSCKGKTTYTGKTNDLRQRTNNHISGCRLGDKSDKFDNHVYRCRIKNNYTHEPFFHVYAFMKLSNEDLLLQYESYLHNRGFDTMN